MPIYNPSTGGIATPVSIPNGGTGVATLPIGLLLGNGVTALSALTAPASTIVGISDTQNLTNKQIIKRTVTLTVSVSTYTPNADITDLAIISSPTANFTIANPLGTINDGQDVMLRVKSGVTAFVPTFGTSYLSSGSVALPTAFPVSKTATFAFKYDLAAAKWILLASDIVGY